MARGRPRLTNKPVEVGVDPGLLETADLPLYPGERRNLNPPSDPWEDEVGESPLAWWDEFVEEQGERLSHSVATAAERLRGLGMGAGQVRLADVAFREVRVEACNAIDHFLAGKVLDGHLLAGEKRAQYQEMAGHLPDLLELYLGEAIAEWES